MLDSRLNGTHTHARRSPRRGQQCYARPAGVSFLTPDPPKYRGGVVSGPLPAQRGPGNSAGKLRGQHRLSTNARGAQVRCQTVPPLGGKVPRLAAWTDDVDRKHYWPEHAAACEPSRKRGPVGRSHEAQHGEAESP